MVLLLNAAATPEIYTLSLHDALPISRRRPRLLLRPLGARDRGDLQRGEVPYSPRRVLGEEADRKSTRLNSSHTVISYAVFCLKKKRDRNAQATAPSYRPAWHQLVHNH